ncbi:hypothetical protein AJ80_07952 [Polytolypa hystricis UAMH7299]|uniref:Uncharacterized protein n=1 Tax=Polytolypa hystricis (strain UAMH7299) TaxID=1447883 RepID=A0A2B7XGG0_POLH7|nr:hypothetical protein AJ80_07952 [Polytolypa hystricis UAMH7299]
MAIELRVVSADLSTSMISSSSSSGPSSTPTPPTRITSASFDATRAKKPLETIEIPENLHSAETYEFMGFDRPTANRLWEMYLNASPEDPDADFLDIAKLYADYVLEEDATYVADDWRQAMNALGINTALQEAIPLPEFTDLRSTKIDHRLNIQCGASIWFQMFHSSYEPA